MIRCGFKKVFYTKTQAKKMAKKETLRLHKKIWVYQCYHCGWYHLTSGRRLIKKYGDIVRTYLIKPMLK